jgi:TonB family protein
MNDSLTSSSVRGENLIRLGLSAALGVAFTLGLFWVVAHFEHQEPAAVAIYDEAPVAVVAVEPPPPPIQTTQPETPATQVAGFDLAPASDNPVKIAVPPPELEALLPPPEAAPPAVIQFGRLDTTLRPKMDSDGPNQRIFQVKEVDQLPMVLYRVEPHVPRRLSKGAESMRVAMLIIVNADGSINDVRVSQSSGSPEVDAIISANIREWAFSPAVRRGVKVKCILEQGVVIKWGKESPFHV